MNLYRRGWSKGCVNINTTRSPTKEARALEKKEQWQSSSENMPLLLNPKGKGLVVNEKTALRFSAVFACIRVLSETYATCNLHLFQKSQNGKRRRATENPLYDVVHNVAFPNRQTAYYFKETSMVHILLNGNSYAQIVHNGRGQVIALNLLPPHSVQPKISKKTGFICYVITKSDGSQVILQGDEVLHIPGLGYDGYIGYSPIKMAMQAIALGLSAEDFGENFFSNGAQPSGVLEYSGVLSTEAQSRLKSSFNETYAGNENSGKTMILEEGLKYKQISIPPEEAQFIETRKFQIEEIARIYRVPLHLIQSLERSTNNNIEKQSLEFIQYSMMPWFRRCEQQMNMRLLTPKERSEGYYLEFDMLSMLRGDNAGRAEMAQKMFQNGSLSPNEWRAMENMSPQEGDAGNRYYINGNMIPIDNLLKGGVEDRN